MAKLGYTWYPKDWGNSEAVFELNLSERGLYRELIDMAMMNDNTTIANFKVWSRKFAESEESLKKIIISLDSLELINYNEGTIFINSCEARLNLVRGGKKGGKKSAKNKPTVKPFVSLEEKNDKPTPNQIESKVKESKVNIKETKLDDIKKDTLNNNIWIEQIAMQKRKEYKVIYNYLDKFLDDLILQGEIDKGEKEIKKHFINWLNIELKKGKVSGGYKI